MRLAYAIITLVIVLSGCAPEPEVLAMKKKELGDNTRATSYYRNGVLNSESISTKNNGIDDVWHFYLQGKLVRIDEDTNFDGVVDKSRSYDPESGGLILVKIDTNHDGVFDQVEQFDPNKSNAHDLTTPVDKNKNSIKEESPSMGSEIIEEDKITVKDDGSLLEIADEKTVEDVEYNAASATQESSIIIEEDEFPSSNSGGSYFQPLEVDTGTGVVSPSRNSKIVPAPVFRHPSDNLEE